MSETENQGAGYAYQNSPKISGNNDNKVSPHLKAWIVEPESGVCVCGMIGEGTSEELTANWNTPYADDSLGSMFEMGEGALQAKGFTARSTFPTRQVWEGNSPTQFTLVLELYAISDAQKEVEDAIQALRELATPDIGQVLPGGRLPPAVAVNIGRNVILDDLIIKSLSIPLDGQRTKDGLRVRATVNLNLETREMLNLDRVREMATG